MAEEATPVAKGERIVAIDVLRGFAVLGILLINIQSYSMVSAAYLNPSANDMLEGAGFWIWAGSYLFGDTKFISIFSMLFGAGIVLMTRRADERGAPVVGLHYRRQLWLLIFGLIHAHFIWYGDILVAYAPCAFVLFWFRKLSPKKLLLLGFAAISVVVLLWGGIGWSVQFWPEDQIALQRTEWSPPAEELEAEIAAYRGGWLEQLPVRSAEALGLEIFVFLFFFIWRAGGLMLVGMALFKLGVVSAERSATFYRRLAVLGLGLGLPIVAGGILFYRHFDFAFERSMFHGSLFNYVGSIGVFLGYVGLVMLAVRKGWLPRLQRRLAAAGRMALTNYISQSVICTLLFYGHGFGLFEKVERPGQLGIVVAIWVAQLLWSPWWLERFQFGPLEWLWRSLTYLRPQPMRV